MSRKHIAVYLRVSSTGQDLASQKPDLEKWVEQNANGRQVVWYEDTFTGATLNRPGLEQLNQQLRAGSVEAIVVWRLDRLGRTASEMLAFLEHLDVSGIEFVSICDRLDTSSATGRLLRTILAGFAEYEREVISERIRAGITKARASGKRWGGRRPGVRPTLTPARLQAIQALLAGNTTRTEIARQLGISRSTVYEAIRLLNQTNGLNGDTPHHGPDAGQHQGEVS